jgi:xanthine dehydrogenase accessory factor
MRRFTILTLALALAAALVVPTIAQAEGMGHGDANGKTGEAKAPKVFDAPQAVGTKATCPVSGDTFTIDKDTEHSEYKGKHVYFCCPGCKPQFDKDPEKFLGGASPKGK